MPAFLTNKNIVLGVTASIAAYKAVYLARLLLENSAHVWPVMTPSATHFIGPLTLSGLCQKRTIVDLWSTTGDAKITHVELSHLADALLVAPATADFLARLVHGRADDVVTAIALSTKAPIMIAPAMETGMWEHEATQQHVEILTQRGAQIIPPKEGFLASGRSGAGRMAEPEEIESYLIKLFCQKDLEGQRVLVTSGPTYESLDPVRFLGNRSSGKMGFALAEAAWQRGAEVIYVTGPSHLSIPDYFVCEKIESTEQMLQACMRHIKSVTMCIFAAAPADFKPITRATHKIKKMHPKLDLTLEQTVDIASTLAAQNTKCVRIGFAAETENVRIGAIDKLKQKGFHMVVANDVSQSHIGFGSDTNAVEIFSRNSEHSQLIPVQAKKQLAHCILDHARPFFKAAKS